MRSVTTCEAEIGVCAACYGRSLASGRMVDIGEAVGIIAAQSIGEPGTQLTMRTFHTGGVAGEDITHGLPRVQELFEARKPKGEAQITELAGEVSIEDDDEKHVRRIRVTDDTGDMVEYPVSFRARLTVNTGDKVEVGQQLTEGSVNPHDILRVKGVLALQQHLVDEVQLVYRSQGVTIHDKHIELIARQMLRKVHIIEPGDSEFLPGDLINRRLFEEKNGEIVESGGTPASARPVLLGITKASLATDSWLSAASFQETTKVLTDAAIGGKSDPLLGLKENVIIGKLIPAGTGMNRYRNVAGADQARGDPGVLAAAAAGAPGCDGGRRGRLRHGLAGAGAGRAHPRAGRADARRRRGGVALGRFATLVEGPRGCPGAFAVSSVGPIRRSRRLPRRSPDRPAPVHTAGSRGLLRRTRGRGLPHRLRRRRRSWTAKVCPAGSNPGASVTLPLVILPDANACVPLTRRHDTTPCISAAVEPSAWRCSIWNVPRTVPSGSVVAEISRCSRSPEMDPNVAGNVPEPPPRTDAPVVACAGAVTASTATHVARSIALFMTPSSCVGYGGR